MYIATSMHRLNLPLKRALQFQCIQRTFSSQYTYKLEHHTCMYAHIIIVMHTTT